ncbi:hypothetical protein E2C01_016308 [Portunus trituberculatus]|uniref:Uncharacterized protein n=1 Tax=Portunus trituberculatus TaxID=210409 RepID=A0A5B7DP80_PORTR|nr:hypothetical protein [Portunus trituberculatus]
MHWSPYSRRLGSRHSSRHTKIKLKRDESRHPPGLTSGPHLPWNHVLAASQQVPRGSPHGTHCP